MNLRQIKKLIGPELLTNLRNTHRTRCQKSTTNWCGAQGSTETEVWHEVWIWTQGDTWLEDLHEMADKLREAGENVQIVDGLDVMPFALLHLDVPKKDGKDVIPNSAWQARR